MATRVKQILTLFIIVSLAFNLLGLPDRPYLVCRNTGQVFKAEVVTRTSNESASCCAIRPMVRGDGTVHYELISPSCCDLKQSSRPHTPPAVYPLLTIPTAVAAAWYILPVPAFVPVVVAPFRSEPANGPSRLSPQQIPPRGPPYLS